MSRSFEAIILAGHKEDAVEVPFDPAEDWGLTLVSFRKGRRGLPVAAKIGPAAFESFVVSRSRRLWLLIPSGILEQAGTRVGETARVTLSPRGGG